MTKTTTKRISIHEEALVLRALQRNPDRWLTSGELEKMLESQVGIRKIRLHSTKLVRLGLVDRKRVLHGYKFRLSRAAKYLQRLKDAADVFGLTDKKSKKGSTR